MAPIVARGRTARAAIARPRKDGPPRDDRRGPRPPRRDTGGPALRLYATTEKKGDAASDSPFAKLLELKLGGKK
jgi:ATP-dependent RNA helicase SUPV3L1/SUV3